MWCYVMLCHVMFLLQMFPLVLKNRRNTQKTYHKGIFLFTVLSYTARHSTPQTCKRKRGIKFTVGVTYIPPRPAPFHTHPSSAYTRAWKLDKHVYRSRNITANCLFLPRSRGGMPQWLQSCDRVFGGNGHSGDLSSQLSAFLLQKDTKLFERAGLFMQLLYMSSKIHQDVEAKGCPRL